MNLDYLTQSLKRYQIKTELIKRGEHIYNFFPKQLEYINSIQPEKDTYIYGGAMGGGKTFVCLGILIEFALQYPGSKWTVMREDLPRLKDTVIQDFKRMADGIYHKYNESTQIAYFHNGSVIEFKPESIKDDPDLDRLKSYQTNGFFFEQLEEIQEKTYELAHIRKGRWRIDPMPPKIILASINPANNWTKSRFYTPHKDNELPKRVSFTEAYITDNPILYNDKDYMSGFDHLDPLTYDRYIKGNWDAFQVTKQWAYCWDDKKHIQKCELNHNETVYLSFDFNVSPMTVSASHIGRDYIKTFKEWRLDNSNIFEICSQIKTFLNNHKSILITGDVSGRQRSPGIRDNITYWQLTLKELELTSNHLKLPGRNPYLKESHALVNAILFHHNNVMIDPDGCPYLIDDFRYVEESDTGAGEINKLKDKRRTHLLDGYRYLMNSFKSSFIKLNR